MALKQAGSSKKIYTPIPKGATAPCWKLAVIDPSDQDYALCKVPGCTTPRFSRGGGKGSKYSTQNVTYHMETQHPNEFGPLLQAVAEKKALKATVATKQTFLKYSRKNPCKEEVGPSTASSITPSQTASASCSNEGGMIQATIQNSFEEHWKIHDPRARAITYKILEMIVMDNQPFSIVNDIGFARLMNHVRPKYNIPSRSHFTESVMPNVYKHIKSTVKDIVSTATALSLTTDGWRALNKDEFISLTAHCVYPNFDQQVLVLHTKPFNDSHTAVNINEMVNTMIDEFSIPTYKIHNVLHDNASNMTSAIGALSEFNSLPCFIHTAQLVVDNAVL